MKSRLEEPVIQILQLSEYKLPDNYLAVMAAKIVLTEKREIEIPGIYQYIVDEMLKANNIPNVLFPASVVGGYKDINMEEKNKAKRKKESAGANLIGGGGEVIQLQAEGFSFPSVTPTPTSTLNLTPTHTPIPTPAVTPVNSPTRETKGKGTIKKSKSEEGPGIILLVKSDIYFTAESSHRHLKREIVTEEAVKYVYVNRVYRSQIVKEMVKQDKWDLTKARKIWIAEEHFSNIKSGKLYSLEQINSLDKGFGNLIDY